VEYHARDSSQLGLEEELDTVLGATWRSPRQSGMAAATQFAVEDVFLEHLLELAAAKDASSQARALALAAAVKLEDWLKVQSAATGNDEAAAHWAAGIATIERFRSDPAKFSPAPDLATPPGQPIGAEEEDDATW
jgi:hypothetical protein